MSREKRPSDYRLADYLEIEAGTLLHGSDSSVAAGPLKIQDGDGRVSILGRIGVEDLYYPIEGEFCISASVVGAGEPVRLSVDMCGNRDDILEALGSVLIEPGNKWRGRFRTRFDNPADLRIRGLGEVLFRLQFSSNSVGARFAAIVESVTFEVTEDSLTIEGGQACGEPSATKVK